MREACINGRIVPAAGFHTLRHTWASHAVMNHVPLMIVARNLGHIDTQGNRVKELGDKGVEC